mgnify:FL=1
MAQLLSGHSFKTVCKDSTKLHRTFSQHIFNHFVNFQSKWTTNVEMTVALKLGVKKSNIVDTSNIGCVWYVQCTPLNKTMFKEATLDYAIQSCWNGFFLSLYGQNIPGYKATLPVLASVCTIHTSATFTRKVGNLARLS